MKKTSPFAEKLRKLRLQAGLTQSEVAEKANISIRGYQDMEYGRNRVPRESSIKALADVFGVTVDFFYVDESKQYPPGPKIGEMTPQEFLDNVKKSIDKILTEQKQNLISLSQLDTRKRYFIEEFLRLDPPLEQCDALFAVLYSDPVFYKLIVGFLTAGSGHVSQQLRQIGRRARSGPA